MRPIRDTISLDEARALVVDGGAPDRAHRAGAAPRRQRPRARGRRRVARSTCRRSIARRWTATPCVAAGHVRRGPRTTPKVLRSIETVFTGADRRASGSRRGECIEIATGAPMPDGADAVVMVEETEKARRSDDVRDLHAGLSAAARRPPRRRHRRRADRVLAAGDLLNPSRVGALAAIGVRRRRGLRQAARRDSLDRQRDRRARPAARPGQIYDINRSRSSAIVAAHGGVAGRGADRAGHDRRAVGGARRVALRTTSSCFPAAARSASAT